MKTTSEFIEELRSNFPAISSEVTNDDGNLTLQTGAFKRFTQSAIDNQNWELLQKCFAFAEKCMQEFEYDVENSLVISWLGKLNITEDSKAYILLPSGLRDIRQTLVQYYSTPSTDSRVNDFLKNLEG